MTATVITRTAAGMAAEAARILAGVDAAPWPDTREARGVIDWARGEAADALKVYDRLLSGDMDPYEVSAPDMGLWWDLEKALEYAADEAMQAAQAAAKRLAEQSRPRKESSKGR